MSCDNFWGLPEEQILADNYNLIIKTIQTYFQGECKKIGREDLEQEGAIGLLKAIRTYDGDKNCEFSTYAVTCIRNAMRMYSMKNRFGGTRVGWRAQYGAIKNGREEADKFVKKHSVIYYGNEEFQDLVDRNWRKSSAEDDALDSIELEEALKLMCSEQQRVIIQKILEGQSIRQVARDTGTTTETVRKIVQQIVDILKK